MTAVVMTMTDSVSLYTTHMYTLRFAIPRGSRLAASNITDRWRPCRNGGMSRFDESQLVRHELELSIASIIAWVAWIPKFVLQ
jgi:hypothetical protein